MIRVTLSNTAEKNLINGDFHYQFIYSKTTKQLGGNEEIEYQSVIKINHNEINDLYEHLTNIRQRILDAKQTEAMRPKVFSKD